jgi:nucleotide-binding universal stress UspA family protein
MNILLAMDGSQYSEAALERLLRQFSPQETRVKVLHVVPTPISADMEAAPLIGTEIAEHIGYGAALVDEARQRLATAGFRVETAVVRGDVAEKIVQAATQFGAELIVVGSHGRTGIRSFLLGSVAQAVSRNAGCTVEIVRLPKVSSAVSKAA